jgi:WD40 repeat protein
MGRGPSAVRLWSGTTGQLVAEYDGFTAPVTACAFNLPRGDTLAAVARDGSVRLYKRLGGNALLQLTTTWLDHHRVRVCSRVHQLAAP